MRVEPSLSGVYFKFERFGANACGDCARFTCPPPLPSATYGENMCVCVCGCKLVTNYVQHKLRRWLWLWLWPGQRLPSFYSFRCVRRFKQPHPATPTVTCPFWATTTATATAAAATNQRKRKWQWKWKCSTTEQMMRNRRQLSKRCENLSQKMMKNRKMLTLLAHTHTHRETSDTHITFGADFCIWSVEQLPPKSRSAILFLVVFAGIKPLRMIKQKEWMD